MPKRMERRILFVACCVVALAATTADDAKDLAACAERGRSVGARVADAACLSLKLTCPSLKSASPSVRSSAEPEFLKGLLKGVVVDSCVAVFQEACRKMAVEQVLDPDYMECMDILTNGPLEGLVDCPNVESAISLYSDEVENLCGLRPTSAVRFKNPEPRLAPSVRFKPNSKAKVSNAPSKKSTPSARLQTVSKKQIAVEEELVSRRRPTFQSSTLYGLDSSRAVDGRLSTKANCTHTGFGRTKQDEATDNPWWSVDLGATRKITRILITNRGDCCGDRLSNFEVRVGDSRPLGDGTKVAAIQNNICQSGLSVSEGKTGEFFCRMLGRYVTIRIPGKKKILSLCEVRVYAEVDKNAVTEEDVILSKNMPTFQSSTLWSGESKRAVDNNKNSVFSGKSCTHTGISAEAQETWYPWWTVDLGRQRSVSGVRVTTRSDCCHERLDFFEIRAGNVRPTGKGNQNPSCRSSLTVPRGETYQFDCVAKARYVTIRIPRLAILSLCEVEVLG